MRNVYIEFIKSISACISANEQFSNATIDNEVQLKNQLLLAIERVKSNYEFIKLKGLEDGMMEFFREEYWNESEIYLLLMDYIYKAVGDLKFQVKYMEKRLEMGICAEEDLFTLLNLDFQIRAFSFDKNYKKDFEEQWNINQILEDRLIRETGFYVDRVPYEQRNKDTVVVVTSQMLGKGHAPTRAVLDYCYYLKSLLKKEVLVVNISLNLDEERLRNAGVGLAVNMRYIPELNGYTRLEHRGEEILMYQMELCEDNIDELKSIMTEIVRLRPLCIWNFATIPAVMGLTKQITTNIYTHFCSGYAPVKTDIFYNYFSNTDELSQNNKKFLEEQSTIILDMVSIMPRDEIKGMVTREMLGLPEDAFIMALIGNRLMSECTSEFMNVLNAIIEKNPKIYALFIGKVDDEFIEENISQLEYASNYVFVGHQKELLEVMNVIDVFVNTPRIGGATGSNNALYLGKPVITLKKGDVYDFASDNFAVDSLEEYVPLILKYSKDKEFYINQSNMAIARYNEIVADDDKKVKMISDMLDMIN